MNWELAVKPHQYIRFVCGSLRARLFGRFGPLRYNSVRVDLSTVVDGIMESADAWHCSRRAH
jgi:hypothetical protein